MKKSLVVMIMAALVASAFVAPAADAKKKKKKPAACAAYVPGEQGAEAESFVVTDAHTAEAPLEVTVTHAAPPDSFGASFFSNIQVDSAASEAGLYISYEFAVYEDHDLYVYYPDGTEAAVVGGFNPAPFIPANEVFATDGTGSGGHSEQGAEVLDGLRTPDCGGYTVDFHGFLTEGGEYTARVWLGEIVNDPAPPAR